MKAEALIGTVLGTCTLQRLIGQGGMGAVYLAQQSRPRRQVAVKVLLPATTLKPHQLVAFLERFRRETDAAASLEHPNIMPVYEYGEQDGLAYLVMPYINGGTLRDVMEREGQLPLSKVLHYLQQLAAALDFAHQSGIIHRDIKPANILLTLEDRVLLTDFGLVKVLADGQSAQARLTGPGAPVGTPDYMAPEQVIGDEVDGRADLYSLGVIVYQMITGMTPFQGETPMQIAMQHLHMPPSSLRLYRTDLPEAAEQVILRSLAKRPGERYARGKDFARAFRLALTTSQLENSHTREAASSSLPIQQALFNPAWQNATGASNYNAATGQLAETFPAAPRTTGLLSHFKTGMVQPADGSESLSNATRSNANLPTSTGGFPTISHGQPAHFSTEPNEISPALNPGPDMLNPSSPSATFPTTISAQPTLPGLQQMSPSLNTGSLAVPDYEQSSAGTIKLTGPVKVVQLPVAGKPGQYVTGLLPVMSQLPPAAASNPSSTRTPIHTRVKTVALALAVMMVVLGSLSMFWLVQSHLNSEMAANKTPVTTHAKLTPTPDLRATVNARVTATAEANIILTDPLSHNIHNWPTSPSNVYTFTAGAYHITDRGTNGIAVVLQNSPFSIPVAYTLTMEEIRGDDTSVDNSFGMIIRFSQQNNAGQIITTFYSFEVVNTPNGEYSFYKYDNSQGPNINPWTRLWHQVFGHEFHQGQGAQKINTFKIYASGSSFTFTVNGSVIGSVTDSSFKSGTVGMLVNLNGTEVAFSNMQITHH